MEICPKLCSAIYTLRKRERAGPTENPPPPALYAAQDQKLIRMLSGSAPRTTARWDFSRPWVVCNYSKTKWKGGGVRQCVAAAGLLTKCQNERNKIIFDVMSEDLENVSVGIGIFIFKLDIYEFCLKFDVKVGKVNFDLAWWN
jgi:hypothetical protein